MIKWTFSYTYHFQVFKFVSRAENREAAIKEFKEHLEKKIEFIEDVKDIFVTPEFEKSNIKLEVFLTRN